MCLFIYLLMNFVSIFLDKLMFVLLLHTQTSAMRWLYRSSPSSSSSSTSSLPGGACHALACTSVLAPLLRFLLVDIVQPLCGAHFYVTEVRWSFLSTIGIDWFTVLSSSRFLSLCSVNFVSVLRRYLISHIRSLPLCTSSPFSLPTPSVFPRVRPLFSDRSTFALLRGARFRSSLCANDA